MTANRFKLIAFDIDGTLVNGPRNLTVWEILNERFIGTADVNIDRYSRFKSGELSYAEWVELDVTGWRDAGAKRQDLVDAFSALTVVDGARETLDTIKQADIRLVAITGTLDLMLHSLIPDAPFDEVYANHIGFDDEGRISHWSSTPFDMRGKAQLLRTLAMREGISLDDCAYVGDSSNDVWIAREAGFTVAFNPKCEELERIADAVVRSTDVREVLPHLLSTPAKSPA